MISCRLQINGDSWFILTIQIPMGRWHFGALHSRRKKKEHHYLEHAEEERNPQKRFIDNVCTIFSIIMPLTTLPQIIQLFTSQSAQDLSLVMWVLYCIGVIPFLIFGVMHKERQLVVLNSLWLVVQLVMIIGIVMYR